MRTELFTCHQCRHELPVSEFALNRMPTHGSRCRRCREIHAGLQKKSASRRGGSALLNKLWRQSESYTAYRQRPDVRSKCVAKSRRWAEKNPDHRTRINRDVVESLSDGYVRGQLVKRFGPPKAAIEKLEQFIPLKREQLLLHRALRGAKNVIEEFVATHATGAIADQD